MPLTVPVKTSNLKLTKLELASNQHIRVNTNNDLLDLNAFKRVIDIRSTPPGSPATGDAYLIGSSPSGAWSGKEGQITGWYDAWIFIEPKIGHRIWVNDPGDYYRATSTTAWAVDRAPKSHIVTKTANFTLSATEAAVYLVDPTGGNINATLPSPTTNAVRWTLKRKTGGANTVTLVRAGSEKIEDTASNLSILTAQFDVIEIAGDGTDWWILNLIS